MEVVRLTDGPIIDPSSDPSIGINIQGPSLIPAPPWLADPLGRYYLYFADHKGTSIRVAYADDLRGPWQVHRPGTLQLGESCFLTKPPDATEEELRLLRKLYRQALGATYSVDDLVVDATTPHIASPDVHLDREAEQVVMYFHGLESLGFQVTRVALSADGLEFVAQPEVVGRPYMRAFRYDGWTYALTMPGHVSRSADGRSDFEEGPTLFEPKMRHSALWRRGDELEVFWTRVGDAPEAILRSTISLTPDWTEWSANEPVSLLRPELLWEGSDRPVEPSRRGAAHGSVNQLRDPAIFCEGNRTYLLYAGAGESAIGIAELR